MLEQNMTFMFPNEESKKLFKAMLVLETVEEYEEFFRDLCTMQELKAITERWEIAQLIFENYPYRVITQKTGASSTTIARVAHWVKYGQGGYRKACERTQKLEERAKIFGYASEKVSELPTFLAENETQNAQDFISVES